MTTPDRPDDVPTFRVTAGSPTAEDLAVLTVLLARAAARPAPGPARVHSTWNDPDQAVRPVLHPGPGAWRAATLPH